MYDNVYDYVLLRAGGPTAAVVPRVVAPGSTCPLPREYASEGRRGMNPSHFVVHIIVHFIGRTGMQTDQRIDKVYDNVYDYVLLRAGGPTAAVGRVGLPLFQG